MRRRSYLATVGACLSAIAGCVQARELVNGPGSGARQLSPREGTNDQVRLKARDVPGTWPQVAHDARNTGYAPGAEPPQDSADVVWRALGERSVFPPVVDDDVYLADRRTEGVAHALDSGDGSERWENRSLPPIYLPPAFDGNRLFILSRAEGDGFNLLALEATDGQELWTRDVTASTRGSSVAPTVDDGTVYLPSSTGVSAFDAASGDNRWTAALGDRVVEGDRGSRVTTWSKPAVTDTRVFTFDRNFTSEDGDLPIYAVDRETGDRVWTATAPLPDGWNPTSPYAVVGRDHVFVTVREKQVVAMDREEFSNVPMWLYAIETESGEIAWQWRMDRKPSPIAYADGYLFVATWDYEAETAKLRTLDVENETIAWTYETDIGTIGAPAITSEIVYIRQGLELTAVSVEDGSSQWRLSLADKLENPQRYRDEMRIGDPIVADDTIYLLVGNVKSNTKESRVLAVREAS